MNNNAANIIIQNEANDKGVTPLLWMVEVIVMPMGTLWCINIIILIVNPHHDSSHALVGVVLVVAAILCCDECG